MKKLALVMLLCSSCLIVSCGNKPDSKKPLSDNQIEQSENNKEEDNQKNEEEVADKKNESVKVKIEDIELVGFKVREPNSIGTVYMETKFKNNSKENIKGISFTYEIDDEKVYLSTYDTLKPGDTSTISETFAPKSGKKEDAKLLEAKITVINEDGSKTFIDYDAVLNTYSTI